MGGNGRDWMGRGTKEREMKGREIEEGKVKRRRDGKGREREEGKGKGGRKGKERRRGGNLTRRYR